MSTMTFNQLLNVFWLRPETAIWRELDIQAMQDFEFNSPSLDLGCGDGMFSFIRAGGEFCRDYDAFRCMTDLDKFFDNVDVFDASDKIAPPVVTRFPDYRIDCAYDLKENLLKKAANLEFYKELKQGNANEPLPFADQSFKSVFSNIIYWLDVPQLALNEISRILKPGGRACLMLPNRTLPEFSFYNQNYVKTGDKSFAFLEKLDRGRFADNIRQARSEDEWQVMFDAANLKRVTHVAHLSKTVIQIWDIGLRPLFPVLMKMANSLQEDHLLEIKEEWVSILRQFLEPVILLDGELGQGKEPAFHCFILEKENVS